MTTDDGQFRNNETFNQMVENGGDAYETAEECFGMVHWLAQELADLLGMSRADVIEAARHRYEDGLRLGGREPE